MATHNEYRVADTNVLIAANGRDTHADDRCQLNCIIAIDQIRADGIAALDDGGLIMGEYETYCNHSGRPGVGDVFFKYLFDNQYAQSRVTLVAISPIDDPGRGFDELPENSFDPSDRKFLAVAVAGPATVINATDSDWSEQADLMGQLGVIVEQMCPCLATKS